MRTAGAALALLLLHLLLLAPPDAAVTASEADCEGKGFDRTQCTAVGCCEWEDGQCWSAGDSTCGGGASAKGAPSTAGIVLPTYAKGAFRPTWTDGAGNWQACHKTASGFGIIACVTKPAWDNTRAKLDHVVGVLAQLIDNDGDGVADDGDVVKAMVAGRYYLIVPANEDELESTAAGVTPPAGKGQMTGTFEAFPNSCDIPENRGASHTNRSTWAATVGNTPGTTGCDPRRDATSEEVLHLITEAAAAVFPDKWAATASSEAGAAVLAANGNCGWGYQSNYQNPGGASPACAGQYAYDDNTCDLSCVVVEGIYWASVSYVGGLMTDARAQSVMNEWLMTVPDASMASSVPANIANARTLEEASPELYRLVSDTTTAGHKWLPAVMPTGAYVVTSDAATASAGTLPNSNREGLGGDGKDGSSGQTLTSSSAVVVTAMLMATICTGPVRL